MVALEQLSEKDLEALREMIEQHAKRTGSARATRILHDWRTYAHKFVKVMPTDYKRVLQAIERAQAAGLSGDAALEAAFEENTARAAH